MQLSSTKTKNINASARHNALLAELARFLPSMGLSDAELAALQALD